MLKAESIQALLRPLRDHGDRAMKFIWKHKKEFVSAVVVAAFVANPKPYLDGAKDLVVGPIAGLIAEVAGKIAAAINWNFWAGVLVIVLGLRLLFRRRPKPIEAVAEKGGGQ